jgi:predicted metal-dependent phosphoesterase TrpH
LDYSLSGGIDLHIHSTASDGTLSAAQILLRALQLRLKAIAITDHDTLKGCQEAISAGIPATLKFLTGLEMSAAPPPDFGFNGSLHILAYGIDLNHGGLNDTLAYLQHCRENRNPSIVQRLNHLGIRLCMDDVLRQTNQSLAGRPHIATAMVKKGYVRSVDEAFDRFLAKGRPAYVDKPRIPCAQAIQVIRDAGGLPVLAHPYLIHEDFGKIEKLVRTLIPLGLMGIEALYPEHPAEAVAFYRFLAESRQLLITGGTDFHGEPVRPGVELGSAAGHFHVPYEIYERLVEKLATRSRSL